MSQPETVRHQRSVPALIAGWVGLLAHLATGVWYAASGLLAPMWAIVVLFVIWFGLLALAIYLLRTRPVWTLLVPVAATAIWFASISAGEALLGWTA
ncbi:MAG TPA: hypothetical protein VF062_17270 [Candidatus Limnocylindrales bacterium]